MTNDPRKASNGPDAGKSPDFGKTVQPSGGLPIPFGEFIVLTALLVSLTAMSIDIMLPALPGIGKTFGIANANDQQLVVTAYFLGLAGGQLFYGPLSDRFGRKPLLLAGLCIYLAGAVVMAVNIWMTIAGRVRKERPIVGAGGRDVGLVVTGIDHGAHVAEPGRALGQRALGRGVACRALRQPLVH